MHRRVVILLLPILIAGLSSPSSGAEPNKSAAKTPDLRALLEAGRAPDTLPEGAVLRVTADLWRSASEEGQKREDAEGDCAGSGKSFQEAWEFTSGHVHRIVVESTKKERVYRRAKSLPFDTKALCRDLLDGKIFAIEAAEGDGDPVHFVGTDYRYGERTIELLVDGQPAILVGESCAFAGYPKSDAQAFAALYEKLATRARTAFEAKR